MEFAMQARKAFLESARPIMLPGVVLLMIGGVLGTVQLLRLQGLEMPWIPFQAHWYLMIYGFLLALISTEILVFLSMEWLGRAVSSRAAVPFGILIMVSSLARIAGLNALSSALLVILLTMLSAYAWRTYLSPSRLGLRPFSYNTQLVATSLAALAISTAILARDLGGPGIPLDYRVASLVLPLGAIYAVYSRDIGLVTGAPPRVSRRAVMTSHAIFSLAVAGVVLGSTLHGTATWTLGWLMVSASAAGIAISSGLIRSMIRELPTIVPRRLARQGLARILTGILWLSLAGPLAVAGIAAGVAPTLLRDAVIHLLALGFVFNTIFGVDSFLIYSHLGASLRNAPQPNPLPYILLNLGILLRVFYDIGLESPVTLLSAPLTGLGIVIFYTIQLRTMMRLAKQGTQPPA